MNPSERLRHSLFIGGTVREAVQLYSSGSKTIQTALNSIQSVLDPIDVGILLLFIALYKPILFGLYKVLNFLQPLQKKKEYKESLFGYIEQPISHHALFLPSLYFIDVVVIVLKELGFGITDIELSKAGHWDLFILFNHVFSGYLIGAYTTKIKDYIVQQRLRPTLMKKGVQLLDDARRVTVDELSSLAIWSVVGLGCLESLSKKFGFGLGSVFALGGIGSASIILALRSTFENFSGGVLLKLQDKFRVGDNISIIKGEEGTVVDIHYLMTHIRKQDDSLVTVPNHIFTSAEVINWSRTPFRKFTTTVSIPSNMVDSLPIIINTIREDLSTLPQIDLTYHELIVAATSYDGSKISIKVEVHFQVSNERDAAVLQTLAVGIVAKACNNPPKPAAAK